MKLSTKLALLVFISTGLIVMIMGSSFYMLSKTFYKGQLQKDIEYRLDAHREVIETHITKESFDHVIIMERRKQENAFIIFDADLNVQMGTQEIPIEMLERYQSWILNTTKKTEFVNTIAQHIPHVWAYKPFQKDGEVVGYLFIDQDTGNFEEARWKLLAITISMGIIAFILSGILAMFFSKKITLPLINVGNLTKKIAKGDFDIKVSSKGNDELADLMKHISLMARQLKEYRDTRQQFLTNVSHDLRTPLTYIKAYAALLKDQKLEPELVYEQAKVIHQEATRMEGLVKDLFELMKLEEGRIRMNLQETELVDFVKDVTKKVHVASKSKEISLKVKSIQSKILADIDFNQFERALLNLLNNAIRHTKRHGKIEVRIEKKRNEVIIEIEDNGEGIPNEDLPHIWDRFYRVDKSRSSKQGGSGLGLAITKQIIERHGGTIDIISAVDVGTKFTIILFQSMN